MGQKGPGPQEKYFASDKKIIISRTFKSEVHWYFYVPEREGEKGEGEKERARARKEKQKREKAKAQAILFLNRPGQIKNL